MQPVNPPIKVDDLQEVSWSPTDNMLVYWVAERDPRPARVTILSFPAKEEIAVKNFYGVLGV
jgi:uncharacterized protein with WD repeat